MARVHTEEMDLVMETCQSKRDTEEGMEKSPNRLEREILNEISQQEMFSQDLMNRIETLETDIFIKNPRFDEKVKFQALFPEDKENSEFMADAKAKNQSGIEEREKSNDDFRYSKMSETQAANLYEERMTQLMTKFASNPASKKKNQKSAPPVKTPTLKSKNQSQESKKPSKNPNEASSISMQERHKQKPLSLKPQKTLSSKRDSSKGSVKKSYELYQKGLEHLNVRQQLMIDNHEKKLSREIEQCTFTPILHKKPKYLKTYENIVDKTRKAQQKKEQKSLDFQHSRVDSELRECTFTPNISHHYQGQSRSNSIAKDKRQPSPSSFHKSGSSSSLRPKKTLRSLSKTSLKYGEFSSTSSRKSVKEEDKLRFRKANEAYLKKKQGYFFDFDEKDKKSKKSQKTSSSNPRGFNDKRDFPEEFSKEISETLTIFNRIRSQMKTHGENIQKATTKNALNEPKKEKNLSVSKRSLSRKSSGIDKKLNSIGKTEFGRKVEPLKERKNSTNKLDQSKSNNKNNLSLTNNIKGKGERFSKQVLDVYREDLKKSNGKNTEFLNFKGFLDTRNKNIGKITKNEGGFAKRYEGLLKQAESITQHLNHVLYPK